MSGTSASGNAWTLWTTVLVAGMLITGTLNTITKKVQNQTVTQGRTGEAHSFDHAWFQTAAMFLGEALCLLPLLVMKWFERREAAERARWVSASERVSLELEEARPPAVCSALFVIPTVCDLLGTTLSGIGLLYVSASVWQMLRGSVIVFSGVLSVIFLKRKLHVHHWIAMLVLCLGLVLVGASDLLSTPSNPHHASRTTSLTWLGILCIFGAQLASSFQMVLEETFIKQRSYPPLNIVGMEGLIGLSLTVLVVLPALYFVPAPPRSPAWVASLFRDDSLDAIVQLTTSPLLAAMMVAYVCSIAFYNFFGLSVTKSLTAVHRTLIDACRTIIVWATELVVYYLVNPKYGEAWTWPWSLLELVGFGLLILGTVMYNGVLRLPFSTYDLPVVPVNEQRAPLLLKQPSEEEK